MKRKTEEQLRKIKITKSWFQKVNAIGKPLASLMRKNIRMKEGTPLPIPQTLRG